MKNKLMLLFAIAVMAISQADAQKIGYLNTNELLVQMPEVKKADSVLNQYAEEMQKIYAAYVMEYQQKLADYQNNAASWSEVKRESVEKDLGNLQIRISDFEKESNDKLEAKKEELYGPILDNVKAKIKLVGDENKFTTILDGSAMLYVGIDAVDILPLVKKKLGLQ
ncbi:MAG TPA: OmpH family outer membrane protein [Chitinophagales bacterium]|nr:OmpH family outer membrane protein [Chitinophagales bacterium]HNE45124.1 OmpH family outer membrane protein [Chitinophagales bacterium]HNF68780.1 OmpH family outer membrane protein [Chitinophagales bacterium]HNK97637.1 OmpH family outer membrane protein [Chitinophagales bacterium]HNM08210.1 OmpH family outer membrane protein [Chitinophagales bacterium]